MPEAQAEILAEEQARLIQQRLATKHDLEKLKADLERDLKEMEQKLTIKLGAFLGISTIVLAALFALLTTSAA